MNLIIFFFSVFIALVQSLPDSIGKLITTDDFDLLKVGSNLVTVTTIRVNFLEGFFIAIDYPGEQSSRYFVKWGHRIYEVPCPLESHASYYPTLMRHPENPRTTEIYPTVMIVS